MKIYKLKLIITLCIMLIFTSYSTPIYAKELDTTDINQMMQDIFPQKEITLEDLVTGFVKGEHTISREEIKEYIEDTILGIWRDNKPVIASLLFLAIAAAVFNNFSSVFQNRQVSEMGFYIIYVLLITICMKAFQATAEQIGAFLNTLLVFMKILGPVYFLSMSVATGKMSAVGFYNLLLLLIYIVELLVIRFVLPLIRMYFMVQILNYLTEESYLSKCSEIIQLLVDWTQKALFAGVMGVNVIQGLLTPGVDELKRGVVIHGAELIPGIGDAIGSTGEMALGTAVLLKNGIGMAGAVMLILLAGIPFINMVFVTVIYKFVAAFVQPITDKRIVGVIAGLGDVSRMMLRLVGNSTLLFLLTIGITASFTT